MEMDEEYCCPNCGMLPTPKPVELTQEEQLLFGDWPVYHEYTRCPECGAVSECVVNQEMIDVRVRVFSCTRCDSIWRVEER
jgi:rubredoxin